VQFLEIMLDFIMFGLICASSLVWFSIWYAFLEAFVFEQPFLRWINKFKFIKIAAVFISGGFLSFYMLIEIHKLLWNQGALVIPAP